MRKGRFSESGRIYLVTTVTKLRRPVFRELRAARSVVNALRAEERRGCAATLAYVLMPDHLHWLLELQGRALLSQVVGRVKSVTAHRYGRVLWQSGFHDHALRREEDLIAVARYIVANPLRERLVAHIGDYPHWHAV
ncbi:MAG: transposase [Sedimenticola sp.]|nr:transposase [Sedimenticola sp.]